MRAETGVGNSPHGRGFGGVALGAFVVASLSGVWMFAGGIHSRVLATSAAVAYGVLVVVLAIALTPSLLRSQRMGLVFLIGGQAFWFGWPAVSVPSSGKWFGERFGYPLPDEAVVGAVEYLAVFAAVSWLAYWMASRLCARRPALARQIAGIDSRAAGIALTLFFALGLAPFLAYGEGWESVIQGVLASRSSVKTWTHATLSSNPLYVMGRASLVTAGSLGLAWALLSSVRKQRLVGGALFVCAFIVTYFDSGTRSWTAMLVIPPILVLVRKSILGKKLARWLVLGPAAALLVLWVAQVQLAFRTQGFRSDVLTTESPLDIWDNDFFSETAVAVDLVPKRMGYVDQSQAMLFVANPIPRAWWPDKPYPRVLQMYGLGRRGYDEYVELGSSSMPSAVGQFYMTDGLLGVFLVALFFGVSFAVLDWMWQRGEGLTLLHLLVATAWVFLFLGFRSLLPGFHYPIVLLAAVLFARRGALARAPNPAGAATRA